MSNKIDRFINQIMKYVGHLYVIGGQGHKATESYIRGRAKAKPSYFTNGRLAYMLKRAKEAELAGEDLRCYDCSGIFWDAINKTNAYGDGKNRDSTANSVYNSYCSHIKKSELRPGDLVFYGNTSTSITHMAVVGYDGKVYEAAGGAYGVLIQTSVDDRTCHNLITGKSDKKSVWKYFGRPKVFITEVAEDDTLRVGSGGPEVMALQMDLKALGYGEFLGNYGPNKDGIDGEYGNSTANAVAAFQDDHGLKADGVFGPATKQAMENAFEPEQETQGVMMKCSGKTVNVRVGPSTSYDIIGVAKLDQIMLALEEENDWRRIAIVFNQDIVLGYISNKYVVNIE